jgi:glycosyltransferase involved in cell wall biosynthesis
VKESELYSIKNADYILAVTQYDQHWISQHTNKPVLLAPNGVRGSDDATSGDLLVPKEIKYALFAASAYLPNLTGFYEIFKNGIGCIAPDQRLVIVGSCCRHFQHDPMFSNITNLKERSMFLGVIDDDALRLVIKNAHTIILPILTGGGSNLKTAEAIQAGCYVVSTSKAMHGFEQFKKSCGIFITDDPSQFQRDVRKSLSLKKLQLDENEKAARSILLWTNSLHELETIVSSIRNH